MKIDEKPKVLQVYALTGLGHLREATSIKNALDEAGIENDTLDILKWARMHSFYTRTAVLPLLAFKWFFEITTRHASTFNSFTLPSFALRAFLNMIRVFEIPLGFALRRYLRHCEYNTLLAVHPWGLGALWSFGLGRKLCQSLINVIPDEIDVGSASFYGIPGGKKGPLHLVNSQRVQMLFETVGVNPDRIRIIGHTLDPYVYKNRKSAYKRIRANLKDRNRPLCLGLYIGGTGTKDEVYRIKKIINLLADHIKLGHYTIKAIPGPHLEFAQELAEIKSSLKLNNKQFEIFSSSNRDKVIEVGHRWFVEEIDVLFAKTGEIIFYSLATGLPHIHFPPKGANEVEHVKLMQTQNSIFEFDRILDLHSFLSDREYLLELSGNAFETNYKLAGAYEVVEEIKKLYTVTKGSRTKQVKMPSVYTSHKPF